MCFYRLAQLCFAAMATLSTAIRVPEVRSLRGSKFCPPSTGPNFGYAFHYTGRVPQAPSAVLPASNATNPTTAALSPNRVPTPETTPGCDAVAFGVCSMAFNVDADNSVVCAGSGSTGSFGAMLKCANATQCTKAVSAELRETVHKRCNPVASNVTKPAPKPLKTDAPTASVVPDPACATGVVAVNRSWFCCPASCGICGGEGCNARPGGGACCPNNAVFNRSCDNQGAPSVLKQPIDEPVYATGLTSFLWTAGPPCRATTQSPTMKPTKPPTKPKVRALWAGSAFA